MTGHASRRPRLLLIPGMLCTDELWRQVELGLSDLADVRHVALTADSIDAMAAQVLDDPAERLIVAGLSLGGIVATVCAARAPLRIRGVALLSTNLRAPTAEQYAGWQALTGMVDTERFHEVAAHLLPALVHPQAPDSVRDSVESMARRLGPDVLRAQLAAQRTRLDYRSLPAGVDVPVAVLAADTDAMCPPGSPAELIRLFPDAELHTIKGSGHLTPLERPEQVVAALRSWLRRVADQDGLPSIDGTFEAEHTS